MFPAGFNVGDVIPVLFDTAAAAGGSVTITGLAVTDLEVYKGTSMTQRASDNGYVLLDTDGTDLDGIIGVHGLTIDTSDNSDAGFWTDGSFYRIVISTITVDGQTVSFSYMLTLGKVLCPTTAGRKLDVSSGGEAGIDLANVGSPTTAVNLSGVTVKTATDVEAATTNIKARIPAALATGGFMSSSLDAVQTDVNAAEGLLALGNQYRSAGSVGATVADKTGYKLASDGLDSVSTTLPTGVGGNYRQRMLLVYMFFFNKFVHDTGATTGTLYADDNTTPVATESIAASGGVTTKGKAA